MIYNEEKNKNKFFLLLTFFNGMPRQGAIVYNEEKNKINSFFY